MATGTIKSTGWKLLWTNQNPSGNFGAQTVSLDLSSYSELRMVISQDSASENYVYDTIMDIDSKIHIAIGYYAGKLTRRFVTPSSTGIYFDVGQIAESYGASFTTFNVSGRSCLNPYKIYAR